MHSEKSSDKITGWTNTYLTSFLIVKSGFFNALIFMSSTIIVIVWIPYIHLFSDARALCLTQSLNYFFFYKFYRLYLVHFDLTFVKVKDTRFQMFFYVTGVCPRSQGNTEDSLFLR